MPFCYFEIAHPGLPGRWCALAEDPNDLVSGLPDSAGDLCRTDEQEEQPAMALDGLALARERKSRDGESDRRLLGNANSHAGRHGQGCPPAPAMKQSGGGDLTAALHR